MPDIYGQVQRRAGAFRAFVAEFGMARVFHALTGRIYHRMTLTGRRGAYYRQAHVSAPLWQAIRANLSPDTLLHGFRLTASR